MIIVGSLILVRFELMSGMMLAKPCLIGLHAFTGSDTTSAFMRKGKIRPFKIMQGNDQYLNAFKKLGETEEVPDDV